MEKKELMSVLTKGGFAVATAAALVTSVKTVVEAGAYMEVAPLTFTVPFTGNNVEIPFGASERNRQMVLDLAQRKKDIAIAKANEAKAKAAPCACLTPAEKAQVFVSEAEKSLDDAHQALKASNYQAVKSAWYQARRDLNMAREALNSCSK